MNGPSSDISIGQRLRIELSRALAPHGNLKEVGMSRENSALIEMILPRTEKNLEREYSYEDLVLEDKYYEYAQKALVAIPDSLKRNFNNTVVLLGNTFNSDQLSSINDEEEYLDGSLVIKLNEEILDTDPDKAIEDIIEGHKNKSLIILIREDEISLNEERHDYNIPHFTIQLKRAFSNTENDYSEEVKRDILETTLGRLPEIENLQVIKSIEEATALTNFSLKKDFEIEDENPGGFNFSLANNDFSDFNINVNVCLDADGTYLFSLSLETDIINLDKLENIANNLGQEIDYETTAHIPFFSFLLGEEITDMSDKTVWRNLTTALNQLQKEI